MSFGQQLGKSANSLPPAYQHPASVNESSQRNGSLPAPTPFIPSSLTFPQQGATCSSYWSITDNSDIDGERDLHYLVSNILDERESQDGKEPTMDQIWSSNLESKVKTHSGTPFLSPKYTYYSSNLPEQPGRKDVDDVSQQISGLPPTQPFLFNWLNGNMESYTPTPEKLPPGLPVPNVANINLPKAELGENGYISAGNDGSCVLPPNHFLDPSKVLFPPGQMSSPGFFPQYPDNSVRSNLKPIDDDTPVQQDVRQLANTYQPVMAAEQNFVNHRESPNMFRQNSTMHPQNIMAEQWKFANPQMPTPSRTLTTMQKQPGRDFCSGNGERNGAVRRQLLNGNNFQDLTGCSPQVTENFQQLYQPSANFNTPKQPTHKVLAKHRANVSLPMNLSLNQCSPHPSQQNHMQNKTKPPRGNCGAKNKSNFLSLAPPDFGPQHPHQTPRGALYGQDYCNGGAQLQRPPRQEREERSVDSQRCRDRDSDTQKGKNRAHMTNVLGEGIPPRAFANSSKGEGDEKQALDGLGSMHRSSSPIFVPLPHPAKDARSHPHLPKVPCGKDRVDGAAGGSVPTNPHTSEMTGSRRENVYYDHGSAKMVSTASEQQGLSVQLPLIVDECFELCRHLAEGRSKAEIVLKKTFPGKWTLAVTPLDVSNMPPNPTKLEQLIANHICEQRKVASLLDEMEQLRGVLLHSNIFAALGSHLEAISVTKARYKEMANVSGYHRDKRADREMWLLTAALKDLAAATRKIGSALWCALQMTMPKPVVEAKCDESCSPPSEDCTMRFIWQKPCLE